jgi:uncharacterized protein YndB with AHSA1/START domain
MSELAVVSAAPVVHSTFVIERTYPVTPERVFAAFSDPSKKRRWFVDGAGKQAILFEMDFRVGGTEKTRFTATAESPVKGLEIANDTTYQDIVPDQRIVLAYTMTVGGKRISASLSTFEFKPDASGTKLLLTEQAAFFEGADGPQLRYDGWSHLLDSLAKDWA